MHCFPSYLDAMTGLFNQTSMRIVHCIEDGLHIMRLNPRQQSAFLLCSPTSIWNAILTSYLVLIIIACYWYHVCCICIHCQDWKPHFTINQFGVRPLAVPAKGIHNMYYICNWLSRHFLLLFHQCGLSNNDLNSNSADVSNTKSRSSSTTIYAKNWMVSA